MRRFTIAVLSLICSIYASVCIAQIGPYTPTQNPNSYVVVPSANAVSSIVVGASPFTYTNTTNGSQNVVISGGTVTAISFARLGVSVALCTGGTTCTAATLVAPEFELAPGDSVTTTYSAAPTMTAIPIAPMGR